MLAEIFLPAPDLASGSAAAAPFGADDSGEEGSIADWLAHSGDYVHKGELLGHAEFGGSVVDITAPATGVLHVLVPVDRPVVALSLLGVIDTAPDARAFTVTFTPSQPAAAPAPPPPAHLEWTVDVATPAPWSAGPEAPSIPPEASSIPTSAAVVPPVSAPAEAGPPAPALVPTPQASALPSATVIETAPRQAAPGRAARLPLLSRQAVKPAAAAEPAAPPSEQPVPPPVAPPPAVEEPAFFDLPAPVEASTIEAPPAPAEPPAAGEALASEEPPSSTEPLPAMAAPDSVESPPPAEMVASVEPPLAEEPPAATEPAVPSAPAPQPPAPASAIRPVHPPSAPEVPAPRSRLYASPRARALARQMGVDVVSLQGSGPFGRVEEQDVLASLSAQPAAEVTSPVVIIDTTATIVPPAPAEPALTEPTAPEPVSAESVSMEPVPAELVAPEPASVEPASMEPAPAELVAPEPVAPEPASVEPASMEPAPPVTASASMPTARPPEEKLPVGLGVASLAVQVDATNLSLLRQRLSAGIQKRTSAPLSYSIMLAKLAALALRDHPALNVRQTDQAHEIAPSVDVGLAMDTAPDQAILVLSNAWRQGPAHVEPRGSRPCPADRERHWRLRPPWPPSPSSTWASAAWTCAHQRSKAPSGAALGVGRVIARPVVRQDEIVARATVFLSLAYLATDITAAQAAGFLTALAALVEDPAPLAEGLVY